jgi:NADH-quinone oxidoreductase subunit H
MAEYIKMIAVSMIAATMFFGGFLGPDLTWIPGIGQYLGWLNAPILGPVWLFGKVIVLLFFMVWLRATTPRIRYDRLMAFGWKIMLPVALLNVLITAVIIVVRGG